MVPYVKGLSEPIANVLRPLSIRVAYCTHTTKWHVCGTIKDRIPSSQRTGVVFKIPCAECDAVYVGEMMRSLDVKMWEHRLITESTQPQHSAVVEHALDFGHIVEWQAATVVDVECDWRWRKIKQALHIRKTTRKGPVMNKYNGWTIREIWRDVSGVRT